MVSIFDKEQKIALRNPARRHSKARKIPSVFKDVPRNVFSEIYGGTFSVLCKKKRPFRPQFGKKNFWEHL